MTDALHLSPYLEAIARDLDMAAGREAGRCRRRRPVRVAVLILAVAVLAAGTAVAASSLLGGSAPAPVQSALDAAYPRGQEAFAPALGGARAVAQFGDDILYRLPARDGKAVCLAVALTGADGAPKIPGSGCTADTGDAHWPIGVHSWVAGDRQLIDGQVRMPHGVSLYLVRAGAADERVPLGVDGFFLWELPAQPWGAVTPPESPLPIVGTLVQRDAGGSALASIALKGLPSAP